MLDRFRHLSRKLHQYPFLDSVVRLAGSTAGAQGLLVLASPILTRLYSPADFGLYGMVAATVLVLNTISSLRYELAITLPENEEIAENVLALCVILVAGFSAALGMVLWLASGGLRRIPEVAQISSLWWTIPIGVLLAGTFEAASYLNVRRKRFGALSGARLGQGCVQIGLQLGLGFWVAGPLSLICGDFASRAVSVGALLRSAPWRKYSLRQLRKAATEYVRFPKFMMAANLLNIFSLQIPVLLIPFLFGASSAGDYFLAYRVLILPMALIGGAVSQVFMSEAARISGAGPELARLCKKLATILVLLYSPLYVAVAIGGKAIFSFAFGAQWATAGNYAQIMAPMVLVWAVASPLSNTLIVKNRLKESLAFTVLDLVARVGAIAIGYQLNSLLVCCALLAVFGLVLSVGAMLRFLHAAQATPKAGFAQ